MTGQETVAQIKNHGTSLEGITPEDQVVLLAGTPLEVEATLGQCKVEALAMSPQLADHLLGGEVHGLYWESEKPDSQSNQKGKKEE